MSDYISKSALLDFLKEETKQDRPDDFKIKNIQRYIKDISTIDETEIIRKAFERVVEELKESREKQIAKKPLADSHGERGMGFLIPICPNCRKPVEEGEHHCECGQALEWGEEE